MINAKHILVMLVLFASTSALSSNDADKLSLNGLNQLGKAKFSFMFWDVYESQLYTTSGVYPMTTENEQLVLKIKYLREIDKDDLVENTVEQWQHLGISDKQYSPYISKLNALWPDIKKHDELAIKIQNNVATFYFNGLKLGDINDHRFGQLFIDIWLSEKTSQPELRQRLLGLKG
ncbi:MAG: chalcone isomerase family protein [Gammaproteobacteria bacterium]|nr:chalcone isomerase family protein [Gammaproteobacteria bacterium]